MDQYFYVHFEYGVMIRYSMISNTENDWFYRNVGTY